MIGEKAATWFGESSTSCPGANGSTPGGAAASHQPPSAGGSGDHRPTDPSPAGGGPSICQSPAGGTHGAGCGARLSRLGQEGGAPGSSGSVPAAVRRQPPITELEPGGRPRLGAGRGSAPPPGWWGRDQDRPAEPDRTDSWTVGRRSTWRRGVSLSERYVSNEGKRS